MQTRHDGKNPFVLLIMIFLKRPLKTTAAVCCAIIIKSFTTSLTLFAQPPANSTTGFDHEMPWAKASTSLIALSTPMANGRTFAGQGPGVTSTYALSVAGNEGANPRGSGDQLVSVSRATGASFTSQPASDNNDEFVLESIVTNPMGSLESMQLQFDDFKNSSSTMAQQGILAVSSSRPFITTWQTTDTEIIILTRGGGYNYEVTWTNTTNPGQGDGSATGQTGNYTISGLTNGDIYQVSIIGDFPRIYFNNNAGQRDKIQSIEQWGTNPWSSMREAFRGCSNLVYNASDAPDLSGVTDLHGMFEGASSFNGDISSWNTSNITNISSTFAGATSFNRDLNAWDVSNVTSMSSMFSGANSFDGNISGWNTSSVTNMSSMFAGATSFNKDLNAWDVSNVTNMSSMFSGANSFDGNISGWNTSSVTNMGSMFAGATSFNRDLNAWDVGNVTNMSSMFSGASSFDGNISGWNTSSVTNMRSMFAGATSFNRDLNAWDVSNVTSMSSMFSGASSFNGNISGWNTCSLSGIVDMFNGASSFNRDLGGWDVINVRDMSRTFRRASSFNGDLGGWDTRNVTRLDNTFRDAVAFNDPGVSNWNTESVTDMRSTFANANSFDQDLNWNTSSVTVMRFMFGSADNFNGDISGWNTSNVTDMDAMFQFARNFNRDLSAWDVSNVTDMSNMLDGTSSFNQDLGGWDISSVRDMVRMLNNSGLDVTNYDNTFIGWAGQTVTSGLRLGAQGLIYSCNAEAERQSLVTDDGWTISGDASSVPVPGVPTLPNITASCEVTSLPNPSVTSSLGAVSITNDASLPITTQGSFLVTWTYTDLANCNVTQPQNIIIDDITSPTATTQNITVSLDAFGNSVITPSQVDNGSTDDCGIASLALNRTNFSCADLGANTITLTVADDVGNTANGTATVTIVDDLTPTVATQNVTLQLDATGNVSLAPAQVDNGSDDNCGVSSLALDKTSFSCADLGTNTVNLSAEDGSGNPASMTATITVEDNIAPTALAQDLTVELDALGNVSITAVQVDNGSVDNCSVASLSLDQSDFDCTQVGTNTVTLTAVDRGGNTSPATATLTIVDNLAPQLVVQDLLVELDATGNASITPAQIDNGSNDNCSIASLTLDQVDFNCTETGTNAITFTAMDAHGNTNSTTANVTIVDNIAPVAVAQDITLELDASGNATITPNQVDNGSNDNCSVDLSLDRTHFSCDDLGDNTVTLTVIDPSGNSNTATVTVTVLDNLAPTVVSSDLSVALDVNGLATLRAEDVSNADVDNCRVQTIELDRGEFTCADLGNNTVTLRIVDQSGNSMETSAAVEVMDHLPPRVSNCPTGITATDPLVFYDLPEAVDNCSISSALLVEGLESGSEFPVGTTLVTYEFSDPSGNVATCSFQVIINEADLELDIPTAFSPNGDGVNDTWNILNLDRYPNARLRVFDVSGNEVFSFRGYQEEWDGNYRGKILPVASYYYVLDLEDQNDQVLKGKITIIK